MKSSKNPVKLGKTHLKRVTIHGEPTKNRKTQ